MTSKVGRVSWSIIPCIPNTIFVLQSTQNET
uniref:Uncharacterized protein n=1 Tax=Anguilla anguilla TaxID=7936 RepID=A0A0E9W7G4_ANGAN